eukprot:g1852.t1
MGSYAKYQERMRRAREQMQRRKTIDIGKEVLTGKLNQTRLYSFMDEPAMENKIDQILSLTVREELKLKAAQKELKKNQDSISVLAFFRALDGVRALEKQARDKLITEMKDVSSRLTSVLSEGDAKRAQLKFFVDRLGAANQRIEELKTMLVESSSFNEVTSAYALDLCAMKAVEQGATLRELKQTQIEFQAEMDRHAYTRKILKETKSQLKLISEKFEELKTLHVTEMAMDYGINHQYFDTMSMYSALSKDLHKKYHNMAIKYETLRIKNDQFAMPLEEEYSLFFVEGNKTRGRSGSRKSSPAPPLEVLSSCS